MGNRLAAELEHDADVAARRGRPRSESCSAAILSATIDLVADLGFAALTMDAVALRAGVSKATIYRRWATKEALMLEAWSSCVGTAPATPDTGSLRSDLEALFIGVVHPLNDPTLQRVYPQMLAAARVSPEARAAYAAYSAERRRPVWTVLERAIERGELAPDTDVQFVGDLLVAPLLHRWLVADGAVDDQLVTRVLDVVLAGIGAGAVVRA